MAKIDLTRAITFGAILLLAGCGGINNPFANNNGTSQVFQEQPEVFQESRNEEDITDRVRRNRGRETIWDLFANVDDPNVTVEVNKYIWNATLDVMDFMPIQAADPFSGVIVYGFGTPPGSGRAYRATIYIQDPALDARSLRVALASRSGPAPTETVRAIEDAILTRARQLRVADERL